MEAKYQYFLKLPKEFQCASKVENHPEGEKVEEGLYVKGHTLEKCEFLAGWFDSWVNEWLVEGREGKALQEA